MILQYLAQCNCSVFHCINTDENLQTQVKFNTEDGLKPFFNIQFWCKQIVILQYLAN